MAATILYGKEIAKDIREQLAGEVAELKQNGIVPGLTVVLVGDDPASHSYVRGKARGCEEVGIRSEIIYKDASITEKELLEIVYQLNENPNVHGILVQLPLPAHISEKAVIEAISSEKDVDGFHPVNVGNMMIGYDSLLPCTANGVVELIKRTGMTIEGKHAVVIGRSNIVGKPVSYLLQRENATVTMCHSRTVDLPSYTRQADILIVAAGKAHMIGKEDVKPGAVVIDVGVNRIESGKLVGDVRFDEVKEVASYLTPVPGGVGPMTITMLLKNTIEAARNLAR
ncbi:MULTISPECIES: bifunctional methylenetetrahydrofolate dehydrogenase/methenyltetrahydrofolate cyclohydrolase FolD [Brevibacillus]|jgi:methylenetetrahydrofolate dehydrogenase (NADP+)/methenyltetrahydrofolate cyclohydrolase|uniref:Bifunctional protein FolD n=1 Tax=Brevibacillus borstelensis AK1 TaxID=1300222 RepID=M8E386_9BACL|nr:bifunctional methylenetetrahydrofolate dehydrogenase/methenyltetrahydrofolate cyclohydrolase FolD [Brevibacillus borstelensis]EMT53731.1 methylenetetrahydrofolate dehydrogenase [Brevibacillus borstelensis AK1]KKX56856.1 5,10-methylene-tetrahydrofolate cyclohydrolase [Brevibacillus borstelensis cifa_chp40]MBE5394644.1 bifunctional methylenetetrahydrofolate dehydrogenase/methenyltetrahydrofolate cyclohydrolase FolD [Brevibacillus borstelensis]MCC0562598.1 bifunctional methylenetetrahydrofolate